MVNQQVDLIELATMAIKARDTYKQENMSLRLKITELEAELNRTKSDMNRLKLQSEEDLNSMADENYNLMKDLAEIAELKKRNQYLDDKNYDLASSVEELKNMNHTLQKILVTKHTPAPKPNQVTKEKKKSSSRK